MPENGNSVSTPSIRVLIINGLMREFHETVKLPGSMAENGKGNEVTVNTDWVGDIIDKSYFTEKQI